MNYYAFIGLFNGIVGLCISFYLFSSRKQNAIYKSFAATCFSIGFWSIFYALWQAQTNKELALLCVRLTMFFRFSFCFGNCSVEFAYFKIKAGNNKINVNIGYY